MWHADVKINLWKVKVVRSSSLFGAVFAELRDNIPEGAFSTAELLEAAQKLIDLAKKDFVVEESVRAGSTHNYYSYNLVTAFSKYQGHILVNEQRCLSDSFAKTRCPRSVWAIANLHATETEEY